MGLTHWREAVRRPLRRLHAWLRPGRHDAALAEELEHHRLLLQEDYEQRGLPADEAAAASRRAMGNVALARDEARDVWMVSTLDRLGHDLRYAARGLRREPSFAVATILTLALGLAIVTTVFSIADVELWKPLPFPQPGRLVAVYSRGPGARAMTDAIPLDALPDWRAGAPAFENLAAAASMTRHVLQREVAESVLVMTVTPNYFDTLRQPAALGRTFTAGDAEALVLSERAWQRLFERSPSALGQAVSLDGDRFVIAGIVTGETPLTSNVDFFRALDGRAAAPGASDARAFSAIGRLRDGASPAAARAQLQAVLDRRTGPETAGHVVYVEDLREYNTTASGRPLYVLLTAAVIVLLVSVVNATTLLLGRALRRGREFALRGALGGGRRAIFGQLFAESIILAAPAGAAGLLLTRWALGLLAPGLPPDMYMSGTPIPVDLRVAGVVLAIVGATTVVFALVPLSLSRRIALSSALGPGVRATGSASEGVARRLLLGVQLALALVLSCGAGLFVKSFVALTRAPLGFDPVDAVALRATVSGARYQTDEAVRGYAEAMLAEVRSIPGIVAAEVDTSSPLGSGPLVLLGDPRRPAAADQEQRAILRAVGPDYFHTLGIRLVEGRAFQDRDRDGARRVAIVNRTLAARLFGAESPIGRPVEILSAPRTPWKRPGTVDIVGVAANVKEVGVNEVEFADLYVPFAQSPDRAIEIVARTGVPAASVIDLLRRRAGAVDPGIPIRGVATLEQRVANVLRGDRFNLMVIATFAGAALLLAAVGVYGAVAAYTQARTRELGVRLALGARPRRLAAATLGHTGRIGLIGATCGVGLVVGLAAAIGDGLYLVPGAHTGMLYGVRTTDPAIIAGSFAAVVVMSLLAGAWPALRASRIDPVEALKHE